MGATKGAVKYLLQKSLDGKTYELLEELPNYGRYTVHDLELGTRYYFRVRVCNSKERCSGWVYVDKVQTVKTPKITVVSNATKKVEVTITPVEEAEGYKVYRSTTKNGKYELINDLNKDDELTFINKTKKGVTYYYKVKPYSIFNEKRLNGDYSSPKKVVSK